MAVRFIKSFVDKRRSVAPNTTTLITNLGCSESTSAYWWKSNRLRRYVCLCGVDVFQHPSQWKNPLKNPLLQLLQEKSRPPLALHTVKGCWSILKST